VVDREKLEYRENDFRGREDGIKFRAYDSMAKEVFGFYLSGV